MIPQSNPKTNYLAHKEEIDLAIHRVLESGWYILGKEVSSFEQEFATYIGTKYAVGVANGTDALELALRACGIGKGDFVVTVSHTAVATATAIVRAGATPLFIDIDPNRFTMAPEQLQRLLAQWTSVKPKAVIPVHLYGQPADMSAILAVAQQYGLFVIEDCAQAHGAKIDNQRVGQLGDIGCFSCYPTKNLGALGDGGVVTTNNTLLAEQLKLLREYGWRTRYISDIAGSNSRLDELQAAILRVKLYHLDKENERRLAIAEKYTDILQNSRLVLPKMIKGTVPVFHQYVIQCEERDKVRARLKETGISTLVHYPQPVHQQPAYADGAMSPLRLFHTEQIAQKIISLPMYPELTDQEIETVSHSLLMVIDN